MGDLQILSSRMGSQLYQCLGEAAPPPPPHPRVRAYTPADNSSNHMIKGAYECTPVICTQTNIIRGKWLETLTVKLP